MEGKVGKRLRKVLDYAMIGAGKKHLCYKVYERGNIKWQKELKDVAQRLPIMEEIFGGL